MNDEPHDPLIEAALTATEGGDVDWELLRRELPQESETLEELAALATVAAAHRAEPDVPDAPDASQDGATVRFRWGPLEVRRQIGSGSFGDVYVAWDPRLQREVALKLRRPGNPEGSRRWLEEARRLARIRHPGVVTVHGADLHDGRAGMWMETVRGGTLEERLQQHGPLGAREAALVGTEVCGALAAVHAAGLVHGDVKTHNIMREGVRGHSRDAGRIVLMDFGSARESSSADPLAPGTPLFTAPEVLVGSRATIASDLWSLGVVLYRLVTGRWPIEAHTLDDLRDRMEKHGPTSLRTLRPDLPPGFVAAVERALERDPTRRWRDAAEFERELLTSLGTDRISATEWTMHRAHHRRWRRLAWGTAAAVVIAVALWLAITRGQKAWMAWQMRNPSYVASLVDEMSGASPNAYLGAEILSVGDVNEDGREDVMIAAPGESEFGEVYLMTLRANSLERILTLRGGKDPGMLGAPANPGDLDGDGHRDLVLTSPFDDHGGRDAGRVYLYFSGPRMGPQPDRVIDGQRPGQFFGWGIATGDVNGDGHADLLVGAPFDGRAGTKSGRVWVYFGGPGFDLVPDLELASGAEEAQFGITVAYLADFNGDGAGDFVVGAWIHPGGGRNRGAAFVYYGGRALDDRADLILNGPVDGGLFGIVRPKMGDLNGDGYTDIAVSSEGGRGLEPRSGSVTVYFGGPDADAVPDVRLGGERRGDGFSVSVDASRDVDGDGHADLLVGAPWYDSSEGQLAGRLYLFQGGPGFDAIPELVITGPPDAMLGWSAASIPDDDGGIGDVLVNLRNLSRPFPFAGIVQRYNLERWAIRAPVPNDGWAPGRKATLRWSGATRADVAVSTDRGATWQIVARNAGGKRQNAATVPVAANAAGSIRVRLAIPGTAKDAVAREMKLSSP